MAQRNAYLTPETLSGDLVCYPLNIPGHLLRYVIGALAELAVPENWEQFGAVTEEDASEYFLDWLFELQTGNCMVDLPTIHLVRTANVSTNSGQLRTIEGTGANNYPDYFTVSFGEVGLLKAGRYLVTAGCNFAHNVTGYRILRVWETVAGRNVAYDVRPAMTISGVTTTFVVSAIDTLSVGSIVRAEVLQNSGTSVNLVAGGNLLHLAVTYLSA